MIALVRLVQVYGEPDRIRLTPQASTPEEQEWVLRSTRGTGYLEFEITSNAIKLLLVEAAEVNSRR